VVATVEDLEEEDRTLLVLYEREVHYMQDEVTLVRIVEPDIKRELASVVALMKAEGLDTY